MKRDQFGLLPIYPPFVLFEDDSADLRHLAASHADIVISEGVAREGQRDTLVEGLYRAGVAYRWGLTVNPHLSRQREAIESKSDLAPFLAMRGRGRLPRKPIQWADYGLIFYMIDLWRALGISEGGRAHTERAIANPTENVPKSGTLYREVDTPLIRFVNAWLRAIDPEREPREKDGLYFTGKVWRNAADRYPKNNKGHINADYSC